MTDHICDDWFTGFSQSSSILNRIQNQKLDLFPSLTLKTLN